MIEKRVGHRWKHGLPMDRWKMNIDDYIGAAIALRDMMKENGFENGHPIPLSREGVLLDGSHRLACALSMGLESVPIMIIQRSPIAPAWDAAWFMEAGLSAYMVHGLSDELESLSDGNS